MFLLWEVPMYFFNQIWNNIDKVGDKVFIQDLMIDIYYMYCTHIEWEGEKNC